MRTQWVLWEKWEGGGRSGPGPWDLSHLLTNFSENSGGCTGLPQEPTSWSIWTMAHDWWLWGGDNFEHGPHGFVQKSLSDTLSDKLGEANTMLSYSWTQLPFALCRPRLEYDNLSSKGTHRDQCLISALPFQLSQPHALCSVPSTHLLLMLCLCLECPSRSGFINPS